MESFFLLGFSEEEFLIALAMASSEAFFNKLLVVCSASARKPILESFSPRRQATSAFRHACLVRSFPSYL
jgi:hypothetical protein